MRRADRGPYLSVMQELAGDPMQPYDVARELHRMAMRATAKATDLKDDWMWHPSWMLWGALTDWVEVRPEERAEAEGAMVEAAPEFLLLDGDPESERAYFDRWMYDRCGYERPAEDESVQ